MLCLALAGSIGLFTSCSDDNGTTNPAVAEEVEALRQWKAGETVGDEAIAAYGGLDKCFIAEPIPENIWQNMQGKTYVDNPYIQRDDLRHIRVLHQDYDGKSHIGEMIVNRQIANVVVEIFRKLYDAKYPIERMVLPDVYNADDEMQMRDNNSSSFCYRNIAGSANLSKHARGLAVDINTLYNPYYKDRDDGTRFVQPATATEYCDRSRSFPYKIEENDLCHRLFLEAGFEWGGSWTTCKDYQHFELIEKVSTSYESSTDLHFDFIFDAQTMTCQVMLYNIQFTIGDRVSPKMNIRIDVPYTHNSGVYTIKQTSDVIIPYLIRGESFVPADQFPVTDFKAVVNIPKKTYTIAFDCHGGSFDDNGTTK